MALYLNWWAGERSERAIDAAVAVVGPEMGTASGADIENLARVLGHQFCGLGAAAGTGDGGFEDGFHASIPLRGVGYGLTVILPIMLIDS
jgi:hypothetical protein